MKKQDLPALVHALSGVAALLASVTTQHQIVIPAQTAKTIGYAVFAMGGLLFAYSLLHLRAAFSGNIDPIGDKLITHGPYRLVRHPVYLAMIGMCLGVAFGLRSCLGIAASIMVFLPSAIWRATLEEAALSRKFGDEWSAYRKRTRFLLPFLY